MDKQFVTIDNMGVKIPAVLWGKPCGRLLLAVHGMQSHKEDSVVALVAQAAADKSFCTLSFDLPEHGERRADVAYPCNPWNGRSDCLAVYQYAQTFAADISIFACSLGAYFTMLAYPDISPRQLLLLSPVVNMAHIIENMMAAAKVTAQRLEEEKRIVLADGQTLDWAYYSYTKAHAIQQPPWRSKEINMSILYGEMDNLCERQDVVFFANAYGAELTVLPDGPHYFHTEDQLKALSEWLDDSISPVNTALPGKIEAAGDTNSR